MEAIYACTSGIEPVTQMTAATAISAFTRFGPIWPSTHITWAVAGTQEFPGRVQFDGVLSDAFANAARNAFDAWAAVSTLTFERVTDSANADIRIGFVDDIDDPSGRLADTVRRYDQQPGPFGQVVLTAADIRFDSTDSFVPSDFGNQQPGYSFFHVVLHEIGHGLGLEHSGNPLAVMQAGPNELLPGLAADDIAGITSLYPPEEAGQSVSGLAVIVLQNSPRRRPALPHLAWVNLDGTG